MQAALSGGVSAELAEEVSSTIARANAVDSSLLSRMLGANTRLGEIQHQFTILSGGHPARQRPLELEAIGVRYFNAKLLLTCPAIARDIGRGITALDERTARVSRVFEGVLADDHSASTTKSVSQFRQSLARCLLGEWDTANACLINGIVADYVRDSQRGLSEKAEFLYSLARDSVTRTETDGDRFTAQERALQLMSRQCSFRAQLEETSWSVARLLTVKELRGVRASFLKRWAALSNMETCAQAVGAGVAGIFTFALVLDALAQKAFGWGTGGLSLCSGLTGALVGQYLAGGIVRWIAGDLGRRAQETVERKYGELKGDVGRLRAAAKEIGMEITFEGKLRAISPGQ